MYIPFAISAAGSAMHSVASCRGEQSEGSVHRLQRERCAAMGAVFLGCNLTSIKCSTSRKIDTAVPS